MKKNPIALAALCLLASSAFAQNAERRLESFAQNQNTLEINTSDGKYLIRPYSATVVETAFIPKGEQYDTNSHAVVLAPEALATTLKDSVTSIEFATPGIVVTVQKSPFRISYAYRGQPLVSEKLGYTRKDGMQAIEFNLDQDEALYGAGARAVGMNRRGNRFQLYNKAHYGYGNRSELMNFTIPMALSSKRYAIHFDNPQIGYLDFDSKKDNTLSYETIGGRKTYQVIAGDKWEDVMASYTSLTGRQPLPPRWAFGNFASRFGYHTEAETRATVDKFIEEKIPLDAIVLDLYWFGKTVKGTMGNLAWDKDSFPNPQKMMADLTAKGVKTVVITEPFVLTTSSRWEEAVQRKVLATTKDGAPYTYDFYFGNTGLIDLYSPQGREWFWNIYKDLKRDGVTGWWGDLGEPEVHPSALQHATGSADQVHNIYGHDWARLIAEGYRKDFPNERPFILMRAGYSGSQRFGLIPWSGDVGRSWGGLQSQMEIALQMGMQGLGYMHSDLGGFASAVLDDELYTRWLQYGVFQPVFRPHAQEEVPAEPVFRSERAKSLAREAIRLRYAMLPYNYTTAFENSQSGMPLMRPMLFEEPQNDAARSISGAYLWGKDFLVAPIVEPGATRKELYFPAGSAWFDFYNDQRHGGGITEALGVVPEHIPVFVRAGAFVPLAKPAQSTNDYSARQIDLHYYHDQSVSASSGKLYDDDGATAQAYEQGKYELVRFASSLQGRELLLSLETETGRAAQVAERGYNVSVHNVAARPQRVLLDGRAVKFSWNAARKLLQVSVPARRQLSAKLAVSL
ncbi:TIM-barrel domain-containing protein [Pseudoduganella violacea]|uniref:Alpha-glucosidase (Family GH31 glycosyl hydrolase) n=1 Tax=Pseudoduganella violacea TaxID=1715466 RepID=A0A7W5B7D6_9BURK|nr:TIM-barrel domain-containing protein [Pseudoduganella violacea]MBB3117929.1 alpha-glucosidase (family GH31 glycosyl hydrolase) [Pseudoduganella violacea]